MKQSDLPGCAQRCYVRQVPSDPPVNSLDRANAIANSYRLSERVYLLGSLERGLTIHSQQLRAHNLSWALARLHDENIDPFKKVAIVGGGIAGLTAAACLLAATNARITIFERRTDICPFQQGCDTRWVHPNLYSWPEENSRVPRATVPVLSWSEGRTSDVIHDMLRIFARYCDQFAGEERPRVILGLTHFRLNTDRSIEWIGSNSARHGSFFRAGLSEGAHENFDVVIIAAGFGTEEVPSGFSGISYWRNDQLAQPVLDGTRRRLMISGTGDGGLIDLFRLTIERFRQDVIVNELFDDESQLLTLENALRAALSADSLGNLFDVMENVRVNSPELIKKAEAGLERRLRKDVAVILHAGGREGKHNHVRDIFAAGRSSVFNRALLYLLYRVGAFGIEFGTLSKALSNSNMAAHDVICRHGTRASANVLDLFSSPDTVADRVDEMSKALGQTASRLWPNGFYPHLT